MRIGLFTDAYTPQVSGVVTVVRELKVGLEKKGHTVFIFTVETKDAVSDPTVIRIKSFQFPNEPQHRVGFFNKNHFLKKVRACNLDIIHSHTEFSLYIAAKYASRKLGIPMVHTLHTYYPDYIYYLPLFKTFVEKNLHKILNKIFKRQRLIITPSKKMKQFLLQKKFLYPIKVIPNGIDLSAFHNCHEKNDQQTIDTFKATYGIKPEEQLIVFVGRLAKEKNIETLLRNFKKIIELQPKTRLLIVGDGPERRDLEQYCHELKINQFVSFIGYLRWPDQICTCYMASQLFMSASHSEVHPITFIEAMASGLPIVCAHDISIEDMVLDNKNGWTLKDDSLLWEKAIEILSDENLAQSMGNASKVISKNYSLEAFTDNTISTYNEVLAQLK